MIFPYCATTDLFLSLPMVELVDLCTFAEMKHPSESICCAKQVGGFQDMVGGMRLGFISEARTLCQLAL